MSHMPVCWAAGQCLSNASAWCSAWELLLRDLKVLTGQMFTAGDALPASHADHPLGTGAARPHHVPPQLLLRPAHPPPQRRPRHGPGSSRHEVHPAPFVLPSQSAALQSQVTKCQCAALVATKRPCILSFLAQRACSDLEEGLWCFSAP